MKEIVKTCKKHGELNISEVYQEKINGGLSFLLRCKSCRLEYAEKNREKLREKSREYEKTKRKRPDNHYEDYVKGASRDWRRKNKDLVNERVAIDREIDPEKYRDYDRKWRAENLEKARELDIIRKHNISYEDYKWMVEKQNGLCAICSLPETKKSRTSGQICRLSIDHDHSTGKIRQLLCHNCNVLIGHSKESIKLLKIAIEYLEKHKCEE